MNEKNFLLFMVLLAVYTLLIPKIGAWSSFWTIIATLMMMNMFDLLPNND